MILSDTDIILINIALMLFTFLCFTTVLRLEGDPLENWTYTRACVVLLLSLAYPLGFLILIVVSGGGYLLPFLIKERKILSSKVNTFRKQDK